jgi:hypothetical protein
VPETEAVFDIDLVGEIVPVGESVGVFDADELTVPLTVPVTDGVPDLETVPVGESVGVFDEDVLFVTLTEAVLVTVAVTEREPDGVLVEVVDAETERVARGDELGEGVVVSEMGRDANGDADEVTDIDTVPDGDGLAVVVFEGEVDRDVVIDAVGEGDDLAVPAVIVDDGVDEVDLVDETVILVIVGDGLDVLEDDVDSETCGLRLPVDDDVLERVPDEVPELVAVGGGERVTAGEAVADMDENSFILISLWHSRYEPEKTRNTEGRCPSTQVVQ